MSSKSRPSEVFRPRLSPSRMPTVVILLSIAVTLAIFISSSTILSTLVSLSATPGVHNVPFDADEIRARCMSLKSLPEPAQAFHSREVSDRYEQGTNATLIRNAVIFTGEKGGNVTIRGDILLDKGIVKSIGRVPRWLLERASNLTIVNANGAWVTPGLGKRFAPPFSSILLKRSPVDLHSHIGVSSAPVMSG
jgi:hypothetical protein